MRKLILLLFAIVLSFNLIAETSDFYELLYAVRENDVEKVKEISEYFGGDLRNASDGKLLNIAARNGNIEIVELLIKNGHDIDSAYGVSPLKEALLNKHSEIVELLIKNNADYYSEENILDLLAYGGNISTFNYIAKLLNKDIDDIKENSIIHAAYGGNKEMFDYFAELCEPNYLENNMELMRAVLRGENRYIYDMMLTKVDKDFISENKELLQHCSLNSDFDIFDEMVESVGKDYLKKVADKIILEAAYYGNISVFNQVKQYIKEGYYVGNKIFLYNAIIGQNPQIVKDILSKIGNINELGEELLFFAIDNGNPEVFKLLIKSGADVNVRKKHDKETALTYAIRNGKFDFVDILLESGANTNLSIGYTSLLELAISLEKESWVNIMLEGLEFNGDYDGFRNMVSDLISLEYNDALIALINSEKYKAIEADFNANYSTSFSLIDNILERAIISDNEEILKFALKSRENKKTYKNAYPIFLTAIQADNLALAESLYDKASAIEAIKNARITHLHLAILDESERIIDFFVERGLEKEIKSDLNLLMVAAYKGNISLVKKFIKAGIDPSAKDKDGRTALSFAVNGDQAKVIDLLIGAGADVEVQTRENLTLMGLAIRDNKMKAFDCLMKHQKKLYLNDANIDLLLKKSIITNNINVVKLLLKKGASINIEIFGYLDPMEYAVYMDYVDLLDFLIVENSKRGNKLTTYGSKLLEVAFSNESEKIIKYLTEKGFEIEPGIYLGGSDTPVDSYLKSVMNGKNKDKFIPFILRWTNHYSKYEYIEDIFEIGVELADKAKLEKAMKYNINRHLTKMFDKLENGYMIADLELREKFAVRDVKIKNSEIELAFEGEIDWLNTDFENCLRYFIENDLNILAELLIDKGVNTERVYQGYSLLEKALLKRNSYLVKLLLDKGANINLVKNFEQVLEGISENNDLVFLKTLLENVNTYANSSTKTEIMARIFLSNYSLAEMWGMNYLEKSTDSQKIKLSLLKITMERNCPGLLSNLVSHRVDINEVSNSVVFYAFHDGSRVYEVFKNAGGLR